MQSRLEAERIIANWERRMLSPDELAEFPCDCCGNPIDVRYVIGGKDLCEDCAKEMHREVVLDEPVECDGCGELLEDEYYAVGDIYCESCFEKYFREE